MYMDRFIIRDPHGHALTEVEWHKGQRTEGFYTWRCEEGVEAKRLTEEDAERFIAYVHADPYISGYRIEKVLS